jgi:hypothetical protein
MQPFRIRPTVNLCIRFLECEKDIQHHYVQAQLEVVGVEGGAEDVITAVVARVSAECPVTRNVIYDELSEIVDQMRLLESKIFRNLPKVE